MLMMMMAELRVCSEKKIGHETMKNIIIPSDRLLLALPRHHHLFASLG